MDLKKFSENGVVRSNNKNVVLGLDDDFILSNQSYLQFNINFSLSQSEHLPDLKDEEITFESVDNQTSSSNLFPEICHFQQRSLIPQRNNAGQPQTNDSFIVSFQTNEALLLCPGDVSILTSKTDIFYSVKVER